MGKGTADSLEGGSPVCSRGGQKVFFALFMTVVFSALFAFLTVAYLGDSPMGHWAEGTCLVINATWQDYLYAAGHDTFWLEDFWKEYLDTYVGPPSSPERTNYTEDFLYYVQEYAYDTWYAIYNETSGFADDPALHLNDTTWKDPKTMLDLSGWVYSVVVFHEHQVFLASIRDPSRLKALAPLHGVGEHAPCIFRYVLLKYEDVLFVEKNPTTDVPTPAPIPHPSPPSGPHDGGMHPEGLSFGNIDVGEDGSSTVMVEEVFWKDANGEDMVWENTSRSLRSSLMGLSFVLLFAFLFVLKITYDYHDLTIAERSRGKGLNSDGSIYGVETNGHGSDADADVITLDHDDDYAIHSS